MGDRCYMHVTCRRQDRETFEALGFNLEFESSPDSPLIEMADEEANYAHTGDLPTTFPFIARHGPGANYSDGRIACDGKRWGEVPANQDGFAVDWDFKKRKPTAQSLKRIRCYLLVYDRVKQMFKRLRLNPPTTNASPVHALHQTKEDVTSP